MWNCISKTLIALIALRVLNLLYNIYYIMGTTSSISSEDKCKITEEYLISNNMINVELTGMELGDLLSNCDIYDMNDKEMDIYTYGLYKFIYMNKVTKDNQPDIIYLEDFTKICIQIDSTFNKLVKK